MKKIQRVALALALLCIAAGNTPFTNVFNQNPKDVWISATRTDGAGLGTQIDPIDGSTLTKINAAIAALSSGSTVHLTSDIAYGGGITIGVAAVTFDMGGHKITSASQLDTRKFTITANNVTIRNLEGNGTYDGVSSGSTTGSFIFISGTNCTLDNLNIHDFEDMAVYANTADLSGLRMHSITITNVKSGGIDLVASGTNNVTGIDLSFLYISNIYGGGQGLALLNNSTRWIVGAKISHFYISHCGAHEGIYLHHLTDSAVYGGQVTDSAWGVSWDTSDHSSTDNVEIRGGRGDEYSPVEFAWCHYMALSNSVLDGWGIPINATITIASPAVVTANNHGFANTQKIVFSTTSAPTSALPTGLTAGTVYYVVSATTNTFEVSLTSGGAAINTSGSQSGTQMVQAVGGGAYNWGIAASTASSVNTAAGPYTISNVIDEHFTSGVQMVNVYGIDITGGYFSGYYSALSFAGDGNVKVSGAYLEATGSDGYDTPISIDSGNGGNDTAYGSVGFNKHYTIIGNSLHASTGCAAEISILSQDSTDTLNGVQIINNKRLDSVSLSGGAVLQTTLSGGSISNVTISGNLPVSGWTNDPYPLLSSANIWTGGQTLNSGDMTGDVGALDSKWLIFGSATEGAGVGYSVTDHKFYRESIRPGVAWEDTEDDANNYIVSLHGGLMQIKGTGVNTAGGGSPAWGSNSPATTNTAPYTWIKMKSDDGSTVYVPAFK